ncbi:Nucleolar protein nop5, partial [Pseudoloma neurophilia]
MPYVLNECIAGVALFKVKLENKKCKEIAKFEYKDAETTAENVKLLKEHKYSKEVLNFLKTHLKEQTDDENDLLHTNDKELLPFLKENGIKAITVPETFFQFKEIIDEMTKFSISPSEVLNRTKYIANVLSSDIIQSNKDVLIIQNVKLFDYLEKEINMHCMRIKEFYGMHFPELADLINDNEKYLRLVVLIGDKDTLTTKYNTSGDNSKNKSKGATGSEDNTENKSKGPKTTGPEDNTENKSKGPKTIGPEDNTENNPVKNPESEDSTENNSKRVKNSTDPQLISEDQFTLNRSKIEPYFNKLYTEIQKLASTSVGSPLSPLDMAEIHSDALMILREMEHRAELNDYIRRILKDLLPNALDLIGQNTLCKLLIKAGSLKDLAKKPASTLQILGAEKALFSSLRSKSSEIKTPKYGILFHTPLVSNTITTHRGKMARMVAAKLAICLRIDYFSSSHQSTDEKS